MIINDEFCESYKDVLEGTYDCVDRIVLNGYFFLGQRGGGFRYWWCKLKGHDKNLNNTQLIRFAGRFSRRVHAHAKKKKIPLIYCQRGERKHEIAQKYLPTQEGCKGVFCILVNRAPAPIWEVTHSPKGALHLEKKNPLPYVNHYSFHIMDPEWGHVTIKLCGHPPFNAQIILNGHEYVAVAAKKQNIGFSKEGNCFTQVEDAAGLAGIADTMRASSSVGHLAQVCNRWIYSSCLCFALDSDEIETSGFHYSYSVYQVEYSRNMLFRRGRVMDCVFNGVIDRTRSPLDIKTIKTIFGFKHRPFVHRQNQDKAPRWEMALERPVYDLTVFKIHFGKLTVKMYSKGERVLRIEALAHNTKDLRCGKLLINFPGIVGSLKEILERFLRTLRQVDVSFIDDGTLQEWPLPSQSGVNRIAGVDVNRPRIKAVMESLMALSTYPRGFSALQLAGKVREILKTSETAYASRQASYDLKKFRAKSLVERIGQSRRYQPTLHGLRSMAAFVTLREKVLIPLLSNAGKLKREPKSQNQSAIDIHYENIRIEMQKLFSTIGITY